MRTREEKGVGTIIDTFVVSSCNTGLICNPETCQVRCKSCPPTASCAHTLVCSCSTFNSKYACDHLHFVLHHQCSEPNDQTSKDPDDSKRASNVDNSSSKPFIRDLNTNSHSYYPDIGRFKEHLLQNEELMDDNDFQNLKQETINKLGSLIASLQHKPKSLSTQKLLKDVNSYIGNNPKLSNLSKHTTVVTKVNKRKRAIMKKLKEDGKYENDIKPNTQLTSIEINKVSKTLNLTKSRDDVLEEVKPTGKHDHNDITSERQNTTKHMKLIVVSSSSTSVNNASKSVYKPEPPLMSMTADTSILNDALNDSKKFPLGPSKIINADYFASDAGKKSSKQIIGLNAPRYNLLREALHVNVNEYCWCFLICSDVHVTLEALAKEFNIKEREEILEKFILAKSVWSCRKCVQLEKNSFNIERILTGYIECRVCSHWYHRSCCDNLDETLVAGNDENFIYVCENCVNMQVQTNQRNHENNLPQQVIIAAEEQKESSQEQQQQFVVLPSSVNVVDQVDFAMIYE